MSSDAKFYQFTVENQVLNHVKLALRNTLVADEERMGLPRKLETVRFVTDSLQRHLHRMLDWEDEAGLAEVPEDVKPHLVEKVASLQKEHEKIREMLSSLSVAAADLTPAEVPYFNAFCRNANTFLDHLDRHEKAEMLVLQQIYNDDQGGEG